MMLLVIVFAIFHLDQVFTYRKSLNTLSAKCSPRSNLLNDCNWCVCDGTGQYQCAARSCSSVDKFGHFRDAIADINVGMEGRGSWRSNPTACIPNTHYGRDGLLCICDETGEWPSPVCRDIFRVLYSVEATTLTAVLENRACRQNKLYLVGCNICLCSTKGYLNTNLCTDIDCQSGDPLIKFENDKISAVHRSNFTHYEEIYAACNTNEEYLLGCRKCMCLRNNRLICNNCSKSFENVNNNSHRSFCDNKKVNEIFYLECNLCQCDDMKNMFCTAKKCLLSEFNKSNRIHKIGRQFDSDEKICTVKEYGKSCKSCECADNGQGQYELECSSESECDRNSTIQNGCVQNSVYEKDCLICFCFSSANNGLEICVRDPICDVKKGLESEPLKSLRTTHGNCEPFRTYKRDCNVCQCLTDGKTLKCTSNRCDIPEALTVKMVPIVLKEGGACSAGSMYYQFCNICVCQENNRSLCTTLKCDSNLQ